MKFAALIAFPKVQIFAGALQDLAKHHGQLYVKHDEHCLQARR
jgi:hypothetical protein